MNTVPLSPVDVTFADPEARPSNVAFGFPGRLDADLVGGALQRVCALYFPIRGRLIEIDPTVLAIGSFGAPPELQIEDVDDGLLAEDREMDLLDHVQPASTTGQLAWFGLLRGQARSALLVSFAHVLGDAAAFFDFVMDWVAEANGRKIEPPVFDRGVLRRIFEDVKVDPRRIDFRSLSGRDRGFLGEGPRAKVERADFVGVERRVVTREEVRAAIAEAGDPRPSAFSVLAGSVWADTARRNTARSPGGETSIVVPVDLRRVLPGVPKRYFGNALKPVALARSHAEILDATPGERGRWIDVALRRVDFDALCLEWHLVDFVRKIRGYRKLQALRVTRPDSVLVSDATFAPFPLVTFGGVRCDRASFLSLYARTVALVAHPAGWEAVRARLRTEVA